MRLTSAGTNRKTTVWEVAVDALQRNCVATLVSVNVGTPADVAWRGKTVHTGIYKTPVQGPVMVRRLNIDGDGQGDTAGHGGEERAVFVYQIASYRYWQRHFGRDDQLRASTRCRR